MRRHYPRRAREISAAQCLNDDGVPLPIGGIDGSGAQSDGERLTAAISRLRASCPDFGNFEFRTAFTEVANDPEQEEVGQIFKIALRSAPQLELRHVLRPSGIACAGRRFPIVEVKLVNSALDATIALAKDQGVCRKPGLIFAAHPIDADLLSSEERELLMRTNWATGFLDDATAKALRGEPSISSSASKKNMKSEGATPSIMKHHNAGRPAPGMPECLFAEQILVLRDAEDKKAVSKPMELEAAIAFLPQRGPTLTEGGIGGYAHREDRKAYRCQVEAALKLCCLLDLDGICIGCAEGVAGSSLFGHPLTEAAECWREVIHGGPGVIQPSPLAAHLKRVVFAVASDVPFSASRTADSLRAVFAEALASEPNKKSGTLT